MEGFVGFLMTCMTFADSLSTFLNHKSDFRQLNKKSRVPRTLSEGQTHHKIAHESLYHNDQIFWISYSGYSSYLHTARSRGESLWQAFSNKKLTGVFSSTEKEFNETKMNIRNWTTLRTHDSAKCDLKCLIVQ